MGVRGLTTYINNNQDVFLKSFLLHDCDLVVDGSNFCSQLYQRLNCVLAFGGDYDKYGSYVRKFFINLRRCNVTPYVIFDGSHEKKKLGRVFQCLRNHIKSYSKLDLLKRGDLSIVPLLLRDVFKEALTDVNVPYTVCEFEADDEIAAMARHLNCPVLSYDSDFFIYNVPYIPFNTMEIEPIMLPENNYQPAIKCKIYRVDHVTRHFEGLQLETLPLLATLLGNDYVERDLFRKFLSELILPRSEDRIFSQRCVDGLLKWLQSETLESAKTKILVMLKKADRGTFLSFIEQNTQRYAIKNCQSLKYFDIKNKHTTQQTLGMPTWFAERIRDNRVPKPYINLYTHHLYFCSPQAEDYNDADSFLCALPILRYAFDIVNDFPNKYCNYISREKDRDCKTVFATSCTIPRPYEINFKDLTDDQLRSCFSHFIQLKMALLDLAVIATLPSNFRVFMISVLWWVSTCEVPLGHVHSLFMCYMMLDVIDEKTGTLRLDQDMNDKYNDINNNLQFTETKNYQQYTSSDNDLQLDKNRVHYEDCIIAARVLCTHFKVHENILKRKSRYDIRKLHSLAQFQCCLLQMNSLNTLCRCPFENTKYCTSFNGTFVYNIAVILEKQSDPRKYFKQCLKGSTTVLRFYDSICNVYKKCTDAMNLHSTELNTGVLKKF